MDDVVSGGFVDSDHVSHLSLVESPSGLTLLVLRLALEIAIHFLVVVSGRQNVSLSYAHQSFGILDQPRSLNLHRSVVMLALRFLEK